ncbi:hypothetical protein WR25_03145 [Diploscapter pachys]|uniref:Uncharacterized protein n=1 Tax=Diploscapter pachys TaxID=2018661 RepID=A0A2A2M1C9_9BILA|nr:hypothetical protein WR25_03145 [Diploscapter pachys]
MPRSPRADPLSISQLLLSFRVLQGVQPHRERLLGFARLTHLLPGQRNLHVRLPHVAATGPEGVITAVVGRTPEIVVCTIHRRERCPLHAAQRTGMRFALVKEAMAQAKAPEGREQD